MTRLSPGETARLDAFEEYIQAKAPTFRKVADSLAEIRHLKLYREQYETFDEYLLERWGFVARKGV